MQVATIAILIITHSSRKTPTTAAEITAVPPSPVDIDNYS